MTTSFQRFILSVLIFTSVPAFAQVAHELKTDADIEKDRVNQSLNEAREIRRQALLTDPALLAPGNQRIYSGEYLEAIDFPVGGLGTGCLRFNGQARANVWQIFSNHSQIRIPNSFFVCRTQTAEKSVTVRALQTEAQGPFAPMQSLTFTGEYPFGWYRFNDPELPVEIQMEIFNPFIPLDVKNSAIPCAITTFTVTNPSDKPIEVQFLATQQNAVGFTGHYLDKYGSFNGAFDENGVHKYRDIIKGRSHDQYGTNINKLQKLDNALALHMTSQKPIDSPGSGDLALLATGDGWELDGLASWENLTSLHADFAKSQQLSGAQKAGPSPDGQTLDGALTAAVTLKPGETRKIRFVLTWYFPHTLLGGKYDTKWDTSAWGGPGWGGIGCQYLNFWENAFDVAGYVLKNQKNLESQTRLYHDTFYQSTLPYWLKDRISSQTAILKTMTCFWTRDGYFGGWEGCGSMNGSCAGNCAHVWHYAQAHARLFPLLGRLMRQQEFAVQKENGMIPYRQPHGHGSFDGQCGTILGAYREHLLSSNDLWLKEYYPSVKKAADYLIKTWDPDENGILSGSQHNTLDSSLSGNSSWMGSLYAASLTSMARMTALVGQDDDDAQRYRQIAAQAIEYHSDNLWNGEYFFQLTEDKPLSDYATGCAIDQMLGQWWAHQLNLGWLYESRKISKAMSNLFKNNFRGNFQGIRQRPREFVQSDDAGMQMITWPNGGRPQRSTSYADEVMSGFEYSAAALTIRSGQIRQGMAELKAVHDRYDGRLRRGYKGAWGNWGFSGNPFGDDECGKFYSRALSSWSVLLMMQGFKYDGPAGLLGFEPVWNSYKHKSFFTTASGWGLFSQKQPADEQIEQIELKSGHLDLRRLSFHILESRTAKDVLIEINGKSLDKKIVSNNHQLDLILLNPIQLKANDILTVTITGN